MDDDYDDDGNNNNNNNGDNDNVADSDNNNNNKSEENSNSTNTKETAEKVCCQYNDRCVLRIPLASFANHRKHPCTTPPKCPCPKLGKRPTTQVTTQTFAAR
uniref:HDC07044 n=1 Tax=Drosophila melanogaster TaxID=7227 RepID=Q6IG85_DROME|nr:TPA_inf: HDC07044 [Drosophila melanogaster]